MCYHVICDAMCLCDLVYGDVICEINAVVNCHSVVSLCFNYEPPWHFSYACLHPLLTRPSKVTGVIPSVTGAITK